jgi:hypothetical protein
VGGDELDGLLKRRADAGRELGEGGGFRAEKGAG